MIAKATKSDTDEKNARNGRTEYQLAPREGNRPGYRTHSAGCAWAHTEGDVRPVTP